MKELIKNKIEEMLSKEYYCSIPELNREEKANDIGNRKVIPARDESIGL